MFSAPKFLGSSAASARPARAAVLLVNLGTPDAPTPSAVRRYLDEFLSDPRVIEKPRWLWQLILKLVILNIRPRRSAHAYARIWTAQGSPLLVQSQALTDALDRQLKSACAGPVSVHLAMTYGAPALRDVVAALNADGVRRLVVLPLYPQYSATSTGAAIDALADALKTLRWPPELRTIGDYHDDPAHIDALAQSVLAHWERHGRADRLLLSFHGIPQSYVEAGDPYLAQCRATADLLAKRLELPREQCLLAFQSRVGREEWLKPYTDATLRDLAASGVGSVQVLCPGFAVDCLETLEEIAMENRALFLEAGGKRYEYIPALNDEAAQVAALAALVRRHTQGWAEFAPGEGGGDAA
ncbi:ferrochelatase [Tahibacter soli]|uniref:Ferrochelatase n=1 Tax=Tahibacter soli TaxID=2983605 RepID=A0A9X4BJ27_9GAMM|nr:ferrochelatase [Tahibacter soli]MDC8014218.1 ferrochelatase [Tahibacter soli]